jgi:hypothetical protein
MSQRVSESDRCTELGRHRLWLLYYIPATYAFSGMLRITTILEAHGHSLNFLEVRNPDGNLDSLVFLAERCEDQSEKRLHRLRNAGRR